MLPDIFLGGHDHETSYLAATAPIGFYWTRKNALTSFSTCQTAVPDQGLHLHRLCPIASASAERALLHRLERWLIDLNVLTTNQEVIYRA